VFVCLPKFFHTLYGVEGITKIKKMESSAILQLHYLLFRIRRLGTFATTHLYFFFSSLYTSLDNTRCLLLVILLIYINIYIYVVILLSIYCYKHDTLIHEQRDTPVGDYIFILLLEPILLLLYITYCHCLFVYLIFVMNHFIFLKIFMA